MSGAPSGAKGVSPFPLESHQQLLKTIAAVVVGFPIAVIFSFFIATFVEMFIETHIQMFAVGATIAIFCMGAIFSQLFLTVEMGHHAVYPTPEWIRNARLKLILLSLAIAGFLTASFVPIQGAGIAWSNPVAMGFSAIVVGVISDSEKIVVKLAEERMARESIRLEKMARFLPYAISVLFILSNITVYLVFFPSHPAEHLILHLVVSLATAIPLIQGFLCEKPRDGWKTVPESEIEDHWLVSKLSKFGWHTVCLAVLGWVGYILAAGTKSNPNPMFGSEVHIFPAILAARGSLAVLGAVLGLLVMYVLSRILASSILYVSHRV